MEHRRYELTNRTIVFDCEASGFLPTVDRVHCIALGDPETGKVWSYGPNDLQKACDELSEADVLVAHNGLSYDFPVLKKVLGFNPRPGCRRLDTLVVARLLRGDQKNTDANSGNFPSRLIGSHSLRAWGLRLGLPKADYGIDDAGKPIEGAWDTWSQEMQDYCEQDVRTNMALLKHLKPHEYPQAPLALEHRVAEICDRMETAGWHFDTKAAQELYGVLVQRRDELEAALVAKFGSWQEVDTIFVPKRDNKRLGYTAGVEVTKYKTVVFNPGSRVHIEKKLREAGWKPEEFTESGRAKLDEDILLRIDLPEAKLLVEYLLVQKRLGQLGDGANGWLKMVDAEGLIHPRYNPCGTVTGRATHYNPNISQVPAVRAPYGKECRALFGVPKGWKLVGADMAGLELRTLSHYLANFDGGEYGKVVTEGDPHTYNQQAAGLPTRDNAKTFIYAWLYGAGVAKIGKIVGADAKRGKVLQDKFMKSVPAIGKLRASVQSAIGKGYLKGLDGRHLAVRSEHSALNVLLQGAGAILCKTWMVGTYDTLLSKGFKWGWDGDFVFVGFIHDELQVACREGLQDIVGATLVESAKSSGEPYGFRVPLDSSFVVGDNWCATH